MVVYLDTIFLLNSAADAAALYAAARLSGLPVSGRRLAAAALLGGTYGALCALPGWGPLSSFPAQACAAAALVRLAFGRREGFLRRVLLFYLLSCSLAGALVAGARLLRERGTALAGLDWRIFFLAGGGCFLLLTVVFRGGVRHTAAGQLRRCRICRQGREAELTALLDTGCTLTDGLSGAPVLGLAGCMVCGFSVGIMWPGTISICSGRIPAGGTAMFALLAMAGDLGGAFGPGLVGSITQRAGDDLRRGMLAGCVFPLVLIAALLMMKKTAKNDKKSFAK